jgi:hypothetical protein
MTTLLALCLIAGDVPRTSARIERTYTLSALTPADAAQLVGRRARFHVSLDSAPE